LISNLSDKIQGLSLQNLIQCIQEYIDSLSMENTKLQAHYKEQLGINEKITMKKNLLQQELETANADRENFKASATNQLYPPVNYRKQLEEVIMKNKETEKKLEEARMKIRKQDEDSKQTTEFHHNRIKKIDQELKEKEKTNQHLNTENLTLTKKKTMIFPQSWRVQRKGSPY